jgi:hypothetical protein
MISTSQRYILLGSGRELTKVSAVDMDGLNSEVKGKDNRSTQISTQQSERGRRVTAEAGRLQWDEGKIAGAGATG